MAGETTVDVKRSAESRLAEAIQKLEGKLTLTKGPDNRLTDASLVNVLVEIKSSVAAIMQSHEIVKARLEVLESLIYSTAEMRQTSMEDYREKLGAVASNYEKLVEDRKSSKTKIIVPPGPAGVPKLG